MTQLLTQPPERFGSRDRLLVGKAVYGVMLLAAAPLAATRAARGRVDGRTGIVAGAVGARNLVEAAVVWRHPRPATYIAAAAVDATHAASMVVVAIARPRRWRLATATAAMAGLFAGSALAALRSTGSAGASRSAASGRTPSKT
jgi:hypothetical protein